MSDSEALKSLEEFLFGAPPYTKYNLPNDLKIVEQLFGRSGSNVRVDGHCPYCHKPTTFVFSSAHIPGGDPWRDIRNRIAFHNVTIECVRNDSHTVYYWFRISKMTIEKVGQYPSLATVSNDEVAQYRKSMDREDGQEFHKAIGLAAHGVGVGSFVYLRRVFERLIYRRFEDFKVAEGWVDEDFYGLRMSEKVEFLKEHLPSFLVENSKIYSILSIGVHELDEKDCLHYFDVMKHSIIIILDEDKKKKEELELRAKFAGAISKFQPGTAKT